MGKLNENRRKPSRTGRKVTVGHIGDVPEGRGATVKLKDGTEVALFNSNGKLYAIENFCPHKGYPLANSPLDGKTVKCKFHGWRFDVRNGECFKKKGCSIESYKVTVEDEMIRILI